MFVDADDFAVLPYLLPGLTGEGAVNTFPLFVAEQEEVELRKLVGNLFYSAMAAAMNALPADWNGTTTAYLTGATVISAKQVWEALQDIPADAGNVAPVAGPLWSVVVNPSVDRWVLLRDGADYQIETQPTYNWVGMTKLVKPMIFSLWLKNNTRSVTTQGVVVASMENSELVLPAEISKMWNIYKQIAVGIGTNGRQWFGVTWRNYSVVNTFYGYLTAVAADFDDIITDDSYDSFIDYIQQQFCSPGRMNDFDI